jgi:hypothetical protein
VKTKILNEGSKNIADKDNSSSQSEVLMTKSRGRSKSRGPIKGEENVEGAFHRANKRSYPFAFNLCCKPIVVVDVFQLFVFLVLLVILTAEAL